MQMSMRVADTHDDAWFVYVLRNKCTGAVYTGVTNRPMHRLRAHQGHVIGGAKTTRRWVNKHGPDSVCMYLLVGPTDGTLARSLEHKWKQTRVPGAAGIQALITRGMNLFCTKPPSNKKGRVRALLRLLNDAEDRHGYVTDKCTIGPGVCVSTVCTLPVFAELNKNPKDKNRGSFVHLSRLVTWCFDCQLPDPLGK